MDIREHDEFLRSHTSSQPFAGRPLAGQKALVTGANSGIGKAVAIALAEAGADVVVNYVAGEDEPMQSPTRSLRWAAAPWRCAPTSRAKSRSPRCSGACATLGTLDILVTNAGLQRDAPFHEMTLAQWNTVIGVNLTGQFLCAREAVREFLRRGVAPEVSRAAGKIICMSSVHEIIPWAGHANYAASKGGVMMMMKIHRAGSRAERIRVNGIAPGAIRTPINTAAWDTPEAYARADDAGPVRADRRARGHRPRRGLAGFRRSRLRDRRDPLRRWRHDAVSRFATGG